MQLDDDLCAIIFLTSFQIRKHFSDRSESEINYLSILFCQITRQPIHFENGEIFKGPSLVTLYKVSSPVHFHLADFTALASMEF